MVFLPRAKRCICKPVLVVNDQFIKYADEYVHLGHVISSDLDACDYRQVLIRPR